MFVFLQAISQIGERVINQVAPPAVAIRIRNFLKLSKSRAKTFSFILMGVKKNDFWPYFKPDLSQSCFYNPASHPSFLPDSVLASWVPLMSSWQCKKRYGDSFSSHGTLCAGSAPDTGLLGGDSCQGASGGGLLCQGESTRWVLAGVVAGGQGCGDPSSPTLYTRVSRFRGWIDEVTGAEEPREDATHSERGASPSPTRAHGEGKDTGARLHAHGKLKHTHGHLETNDIGDFREARRPHANQRVGTHARSAHARQRGDASTDAQTAV